MLNPVRLVQDEEILQAQLSSLHSMRESLISLGVNPLVSMSKQLLEADINSMHATRPSTSHHSQRLQSSTNQFSSPTADDETEPILGEAAAALGLYNFDGAEQDATDMVSKVCQLVRYPGSLPPMYIVDQ